ncbi:MAG TPA: aldo/keto reductase, partial [Burkholderiaceae bacterium]|nr:aldo/keto reductase [Burkholderiaceae bacterium]
TSFALLDRFVERGFDTIDTADVYSAWAPGNAGGESETVIGNWLARRKRRDDVVLMTKVGMLEARKGLSAANIEAAAEDSLRRLRTDYIDVYFAHVDDADAPLDETLSAFARLVESGKVRTIGASNYGAERLEQALSVSKERGLPRYELLQPRYNLYDRGDFESSLARVAGDNELGVVCYFALASGFLSGKYREARDFEGKARAGFAKDYLNERGLAILAALDEVAAQSEATPAQVALAWLLTRPQVTAPIVSATSLAQLDETLAAATLSLPESAVAALDRASAMPA